MPPRPKALLIWAALSAALVVPVALSLTSPLLAWRDPVYIAAGLAGVIAMALLLLQPLQVSGALPGLPRTRGRKTHRWVGIALVATVLAHVGGLWLTSPPDVVDALLLRSPTPFSVWGVLAMWALFAAALLVALHQRLRWRHWRIAHATLGLLVVSGSVAHALLIEGTMEVISKIVLCVLVIAATLKTYRDLRVWRYSMPPKT